MAASHLKRPRLTIEPAPSRPPRQDPGEPMADSSNNFTKFVPGFDFQQGLGKNARVRRATIQALEVQRLALSTLKSRNVPLGDLSQALKVPPMPMGLPAMP